MTEKPDPIEGFDLVDYDPETQKLTIRIHDYILARASQQDALRLKAIEIITDGPGVDGVVFIPRSEDEPPTEA